MEGYAIRINDITKIYNLYQKPFDRLKESMNFSKKKFGKEFFALDGITVDILEKQAIGIIGTNGSGKSTLLKIICGVLTPTSGSIEINGKVSALLELGAGFNPEYTGIENIYLNGTLMGYTNNQIDEKLDQIMEFADIGEFIYQPVKTYSSGMFARLAFAVSINVEPDILIVDEALSVGDIRFQQKCFRKMEEIKKEKTVLMVSHDLGAIGKFCDKVIWVENGKLMEYGEPKEIIKKYQAYLMESKIVNTKKNTDAKIDNNDKNLQKIDEKFQWFGNKKSEILGIGLFNESDIKMIQYVQGGDKLKLIMRVRHNEDISNTIVGFTVSDRLGNNIFSINSYLSRSDMDTSKGEVFYECYFVMPDLNEGPYTISPAIAVGSQAEHIMYHWVYDAYTIEVISPYNELLPGILAIREFEFSKYNS